MEKNSVAGLLTSVDELFMTDGEREENQLPRIREIPLSEIDDFPDHPFKVKLDEDMDELVQSGTLRPGMRVLTMGFGGGLTWAGALLRW